MADCHSNSINIISSLFRKCVCFVKKKGRGDSDSVTGYTTPTRVLQ